MNKLWCSITNFNNKAYIAGLLLL